MEKFWTETSTKIYEWTISTWKILPESSVLRKWKVKSQSDTITFAHSSVNVDKIKKLKQIELFNLKYHVSDYVVH